MTLICGTKPRRPSREIASMPILRNKSNQVGPMANHHRKLGCRNPLRMRMSWSFWIRKIFHTNGLRLVEQARAFYRPHHPTRAGERRIASGSAAVGEWRTVAVKRYTHIVLFRMPPLNGLSIETTDGKLLSDARPRGIVRELNRLNDRIKQLEAKVDELHDLEKWLEGR
jgi:hypothetical protein